VIHVQLSNGFGNNLFQYNAALLLADYLEQQVVALPPSPEYCAIPCLEKLGFNFRTPLISELDNTIDDSNYRLAFNKGYSKHNFLLRGHFEDYTFYENHLSKIKQWYPPIKKRSNKDLVIHFRAGDRLFYKNEFYTKPTADDYIRAIEKFDFEQIHIVTDMPKWDYITEQELEEMKFHHTATQDQSVPISESVDYFNSFITAFAIYNPKMENRTIVDDFNFIRTFDNILFQHGTLAWWAAALSDASKVGVYAPWRPFKGDSNKNLSKIPLKGWFQWE
jgi:hypothetical protein